MTKQFYSLGLSVFLASNPLLAVDEFRTKSTKPADKSSLSRVMSPPTFKGVGNADSLKVYRTKQLETKVGNALTGGEGIKNDGVFNWSKTDAKGRTVLFISNNKMSDKAKTALKTKLTELKDSGQLSKADYQKAMDFVNSGTKENPFLMHMTITVDAADNLSGKDVVLSNMKIEVSGGIKSAYAGFRQSSLLPKFRTPEMMAQITQKLDSAGKSLTLSPEIQVDRAVQANPSLSGSEDRLISLPKKGFTRSEVSRIAKSSRLGVQLADTEPAITKSILANPTLGEKALNGAATLDIIAGPKFLGQVIKTENRETVNTLAYSGVVGPAFKAGIPSETLISAARGKNGSNNLKAIGGFIAAHNSYGKNKMPKSQINTILSNKTNLNFVFSYVATAKTDTDKQDKAAAIFEFFKQKGPDANLNQFVAFEKQWMGNENATPNLQDLIPR